MRVFVKCRVRVGMFDTEYLVQVEGTSTLVSRRSVRVKSAPSPEVDGEVSAYLVKQAEGKALVELPGEPVVGGTRAWIPDGTFAFA